MSPNYFAFYTKNFIKNAPKSLFLAALFIVCFPLAVFCFVLRDLRPFSSLNKIHLSLKLPDGNRLFCRLPDIYTIGEIYFFDVYEMQPSDYDLVIDVGANIGIFSLRQSRLSKAAEIISLEPDPENFSLLKNNIKINNHYIKALPIAASDKDGHEGFFVNEYKVMSSIYPIGVSKKIDVEMRSIDSLLEGRKCKKMLIKIDVEGAEMLVLRGARETLHEDVTIVVEVHNDFVRTEEVENYLKGFGFKTKTTGVSPNIIILASKS